MNQTKPMRKIQQIENEIQELMVEAQEIIMTTRPDVSGIGFTTENGGYFGAWSEGKINAAGSSFKECLDHLPDPTQHWAMRIKKLRAELAQLEGEGK